MTDNYRRFWVYIIKTPNNMYYPGCSGKKYLCQRWNPKMYEHNSLKLYIEQFGWENLEKIVLIDNLTKEEALQWEDKLICMYRQLGCCINKLRSGNRTRLQQSKEYYQNNKEKITLYKKQYKELYPEKIKEQSKQYYESHKDEIKNQKKEYYDGHREEILKKKSEYHKEHKEERRKYDRKLYATPEGKIYYRVKSYNSYHTPIETPKEAKQKYLETGYIPSYIKNDDLI